MLNFAYLPRLFTTPTVVRCSPSRSVIGPAQLRRIFTCATAIGFRRSRADGLDIMSEMTYVDPMDERDKPLVWLHGEVKTPPFSQPARLEAGFLLRRLQRGERLGLPSSRPMPGIGRRCHELRIHDQSATWRIIYRIDDDAIVILEVFQKQIQQTPLSVVEVCKKRIRMYDTRK